LVVAALGCALVFATACGDDDDTTNETPGGGTKATAGTGGSSAGKGGSSTAGTENTPMGGGGVGTTEPVVGGAGGEGGAAPVNCTDADDKDCYKCAPSTLTQFLNQCPTTGCEPFDNSALTSFKNGKLPKL